MKRHSVILLFLVCILCFLILVPELQAPQITDHDMLGYDTYRVAENGAIVDRDGAIKGWIHGNTVYDAQWNEKYFILEKRLYCTDIDPRG